MFQNHVDLSGNVHAVPTRSTATAADAAAIIRDMCLRSSDGFPDVEELVHCPEKVAEYDAADPRRTSLGSAEAPSLLDWASHGPAGRWVLLQRVR